MGEDFFSEKIRGQRLFWLKKGGRRLFRQNFSKTRPRYPVNFDRSLKGRFFNKNPYTRWKTFFKGCDLFQKIFVLKHSRPRVNHVFVHILIYMICYPVQEGGFKIYIHFSWLDIEGVWNLLNSCGLKRRITISFVNHLSVH